MCVKYIRHTEIRSTQVYTEICWKIVNYQKALFDLPQISQLIRLEFALIYFMKKKGGLN